MAGERSNNPFNPIAAKTRLRVNGTLGFMNRAGKIVLGLLAASYIGSGVALLAGAQSIGRLLILPALLVSGLAFLGHLVTLDEDMPGEWSNPAGSRKVWVSSVAELCAKLGAFAIALALLISQDS